MVKPKKNKRSDVIQLLLVVVIILLLNIISSFVFYRFDLTAEKRYTLSESTKSLLANVKDVVYVKVYLEGDFPSGFKRLRNETKIMLDEFREYANGNLEYEFINPSASSNKKEREDVYRQLYQKGLMPTNLEVKDEHGKSEQIIFPAALVAYKGKEAPWQLLQQQVGIGSDEVLNNSVQALEFGLASSIKNLDAPVKPKIAFLHGHGELDTLRVADIVNTLKVNYEIHRVALDENLSSLSERDSVSTGEITVRNKFKAIVIAKPDSAFSEKDKFIIDQYVMNGGKVLWLLDMVYTDLDSLSTGFTIGLSNTMNLDDLLFKYGVRINSDLIQDLQSSFIMVNKGLAGNAPRWELEPWLFNPLVSSQSKHPVVNNLDLIKFEFVSSIDTVSVKGVSKTVLLTSSKYTKVVNAPARIALAMVNIKPDEMQFRDSFKPVAVLLEGEFESLYKNRGLTKKIAEDKHIAFKEKSKPTSMIVISDGDVIKNVVQRSIGKIFPLGYDMATRQTFANKNLMLNCIDYLCDDSGILSLRSREVKLRMLDSKKIKTQKIKWQIINTAFPVLVLFIVAVILFYIRRKRFS